MPAIPTPKHRQKDQFVKNYSSFKASKNDRTKNQILIIFKQVTAKHHYLQTTYLNSYAMHSIRKTHLIQMECCFYISKTHKSTINLQDQTALYLQNSKLHLLICLH